RGGRSSCICPRGPSCLSRRERRQHPGHGADMTGARQIVAGLESAGVTIAASVPDTWIGKLVEEVHRSSAIRVVDVAREEEAAAESASPYVLLISGEDLA